MPIITSIETVIGFLGEAIHYGPAVISFISSTVTAVEATGKSGVDKLTAVLNAVGVFASAILPSEAAMIQAFMAAVEALVADLVALWNTAGVFLHGAAPAAA